MIFLASRANLDTRTLLTRIHNQLQTRVDKEDSPVEQVWYHTSSGNKIEVRATINAQTFLGTTYSVAEVELHVAFDLPLNHSYDFYKIQWVEAETNLMIGWHQDETDMDLDEWHLQIDNGGETVQRETAAFLDKHPLNVVDQRTDHLVETLRSLTWADDVQAVPTQAVH